MPFIRSSFGFWNQLLPSLDYDFYQLSGYCELEAEVLQGKPLAWYSKIEGAKFIIPLIERVVYKNGNTEKDLVSPYGYAGMAFSKDTSKGKVIKAFNLFNEESMNEGYVSSFLRLHPIYNAFDIQCSDTITQHYHGHTVGVDLTSPINSIRHVYSNDHKRNLNRLNREKFKVEINNWDRMEQFITLYTRTMERKNAKLRYFFSPSYFIELKRLLNNDIVLISVVDNKGVMASGGIFIICNELAQFHLSGTMEEFIKHSPSRRMLDTAIEICKAKGAHTLHLGGGYDSSNSDGLFRFKSGFGSQLYKFSTLRFIHNPAKYNQLLEKKTFAKSDSFNYFPEYRFLSGS
jgi:hypothetical protein